VAERFIAEGGRVFLCAATASDLQRQPRASKATPCMTMPSHKAADVSSLPDVERIVERAIAALEGWTCCLQRRGLAKGPIESVDWNSGHTPSTSTCAERFRAAGPSFRTFARGGPERSFCFQEVGRRNPSRS
jgi:NAD(P)-dependent dehydrogenase (short-subunit alcohol dehydrogenase family)